MSNEKPEGAVQLEKGRWGFIRNQVGSDKLTFSVSFAWCREMEANVAGSFLEGEVWRELAESGE